MNQDALSLTGLRLGIFSQIYLILQHFDENSQNYDTRQEDIYNIFLEASRLENVVSETSTNPVTSAAIFAHVAALLLLYRRNDEEIPMVDISGLLEHLQSTYRPLTNVQFSSLVSQSTISYDNGTDLKTTITNLNTRLTEDENELHSMAVALAGTDFMQTAAAKENWLQTHVRDYVLDSVLKSSKLHQVYETSNEWTISWGIMNNYLCSLTSTDRGYMPDQVFAGQQEIKNRLIFRRFRFVPSGLWTPLNPIPTESFFPTDMNVVFENDIELRGQSSFLVGKIGTPQEGKFRVKAVTDYGLYTGKLADDPLSVASTSDLLIMDTNHANFSVNINCPSLSINGINVEPGGSSNTYNTYNQILEGDHNFTQNITRKNLHAHYNVNSEQNFHYTAPSRTVINRSVNHQIQTFHEQTVKQTVNRNFKSIRVVPNQFFSDFNFYHQKRSIHWNSVQNKPDFDAQYANLNHHHDSQYADIGHHHDSQYAAFGHNHDSQYAVIGHHHDSQYAAIGHHHDSDYYTQDVTNALLGTKVDNQNFVSQLALKQDAGDYATNTAMNNALALKAGTSDVYNQSQLYTKTEIDGMVGDKITLTGMLFTLKPYLYRTDVYSNGVRVNYVNDQGQDENMILVKLATFEALETQVTNLTSRVTALENLHSNLTIQQQDTSSLLTLFTTNLNNDIQLTIQRLEAIGA